MVMDSELKSPYKISLDFYIRKIITVNAKQLDTNSRIVNITCTNNGKKVMLDSSAIFVFVRYKKSDGNAVLNEVPILDDGTVNLELTQQMLAVEGRHLVDIMLINGTGLTTETVENILNSETMDGISVLSTMSFYINTEGVAIDGSQIESSYEYNALIDGLGKMVAVDQRMTTLENTINANETQRQADEKVRQNDEATRKSAETSRVNAEKQREQNVKNTINNCISKTDNNISEYTEQMTTIIENSNQAITNANSATSKANESARLADIATENATMATSDATQTTQQMQNIMDEINQTIGGVIRDDVQSSTTTYSSEKIEERDIAENPVTFETFDDKGKETYMDTEVIASGDKLGEIISKLTKSTNNLRYIYDSLSLQTMINSGYYYVGNEIVNLHNNLSQLSNPNLLINGDFQVWQRGTSIQTVVHEAFRYNADRWCHYTSVDTRLIKKLTNGMYTEANIYQFLEKRLETGKPYVLSASVNGEIYTLNIIGGTESSTNRLRYYVDANFDRIGIIFDSKTEGFTSMTVNWVKLEKGTVCTPFVPRLYIEELQMCQRYYYVLPFANYTGFAGSGGTIWIRIPFNMRVTPSYSTDIKTVYVASLGNRFSFTYSALNLEENSLGICVVNPTEINRPVGVYWDTGKTIKLDAEIY